MRNSIQYRVWGRAAMFTDPVTKLGGEKCSYHLPTYEALKGITESIYWKPTIVWVIDRVRIMRAVRTQTKGVKPLRYSEGGNDLSIYTYLNDVEYQVGAHFEWNLQRGDLVHDRIDGKHFEIAKRMIALGGRRDIFLGTRECQGYVQPCTFGSGESYYDAIDEIAFGLSLHGLDYPSETGGDMLYARFWNPVVKRSILEFARPEACVVRRPIRSMRTRQFVRGTNFSGIDDFDLLQ